MAQKLNGEKETRVTPPMRENKAQGRNIPREQRREPKDSNTTNKLRSKLEELESAWSLEKIMKLAIAGFTLLSIFLNNKSRRKLEEFADSIASILGVESLQDWTPPDNILKKLGIRHEKAISEEIEYLKTQLS